MGLFNKNNKNETESFNPYNKVWLDNSYNDKNKELSLNENLDNYEEEDDNEENNMNSDYNIIIKNKHNEIVFTEDVKNVFDFTKEVDSSEKILNVIFINENDETLLDISLHTNSCFFLIINKINKGE